MNCYYSNLIEGHDTHPIDIERAMNKDYSADPQQRDLQLEAEAHIAVQKWIVAMAGKGEVHALKSFLRKRGPDSDLLPGCDVNAALPKSGRSALMAAALANQVCAHQHAHT